jgi:hypothetical protein
MSIDDRIKLIRQWYERDQRGALSWLRAGLPTENQPTHFIRVIAIADIVGYERGEAAALLAILHSVNDALANEDLNRFAAVLGAKDLNEAAACGLNLLNAIGESADLRAIPLLETTRTLLRARSNPPRRAGQQKGGADGRLFEDWPGAIDYALSGCITNTSSRPPVRD